MLPCPTTLFAHPALLDCDIDEDCTRQGCYRLPTLSRRLSGDSRGSEDARCFIWRQSLNLRSRLAVTSSLILSYPVVLFFTIVASLPSQHTPLSSVTLIITDLLFGLISIRL